MGRRVKLKKNDTPRVLRPSGSDGPKSRPPCIEYDGKVAIIKIKEGITDTKEHPVMLAIGCTSASSLDPKSLTRHEAVAEEIRVALDVAWHNRKVVGQEYFRCMKPFKEMSRKRKSVDQYLAELKNPNLSQKDRERLFKELETMQSTQ